MQTRITINDREYQSIEQMPPDDRKVYDQAIASALADRNGNGIPDILEGACNRADLRFGFSLNPGNTSIKSVTTTTRYSVNGQEYQRWEDIPADVRAKLTAAGAKPPAFEAAATEPALASVRGTPLSPSTTQIQFNISWSTVLAAVAALAVTALIGWFVLRR